MPNTCPNRPERVSATLEDEADAMGRYGLIFERCRQTIARMQIAIKVDSRPPRAMGARLSSRLSWWRRLEEG